MAKARQRTMKDDKARGIYHTKGRCRCWADGDAVYVATTCYILEPVANTPAHDKVRQGLRKLRSVPARV